MEVEIRVLEALLEIMFDLYAHDREGYFDFVDARKLSPSFSIPVLTEALRQGFNLGLIVRTNPEYPGSFRLSTLVQDTFWQHPDRLFDKKDPDLFFEVFGVTRHAEEE